VVAFKSSALQRWFGLAEENLSILTAIFPGELGLASFVEAKDDGSGGANWSCEACKAPVKKPHAWWKVC